MRTAVAAAALGIGVPRLIACECRPTPPPCQAYWQSPLVFLGTVTEEIPTADAQIVRYRMTVDHAYKGVTENEVMLRDDGMCDGPAFQVGEQYLMYTRPYDDVDLYARGCTRSSHVKFAQEDLKYLKGLESASPTAAVFGLVAAWPEGPGDKTPLAGAIVQLEGGDRTLTATADESGRYSFDGLKPGKYSVRADQPGFHMPLRDYGMFSEAAAERGCARIDVTLLKDWPGVIAGHLARPDGKPAAAGIDLRLLRLGDDADHFAADDEIQTDGHGDYEFRDVRPGRYKLVLHWCCYPTREAPYPAIYWPAGASEEDGAEIVVGTSFDAMHYDFRLPPEHKSRTVWGQVLLPDGKPAPGAEVWLLHAGDDRHECCEPIETVRADAEGRFSVTILQGVHYGLALHGRLSEMTPVSFEAAPKAIVLRVEAGTVQ
jgi:protocatechuate 3,4-dioxygenase beta subunit